MSSQKLSNVDESIPTPPVVYRTLRIGRSIFHGSILSSEQYPKGELVKVRLDNLPAWVKNIQNDADKYGIEVGDVLRKPEDRMNDFKEADYYELGIWVRLYKLDIRDAQSKTKLNFSDGDGLHEFFQKVIGKNIIGKLWAPSVRHDTTTLQLVSFTCSEMNVDV
jgi:hypothetical protein